MRADRYGIHSRSLAQDQSVEVRVGVEFGVEVGVGVEVGTGVGGRGWGRGSGVEARSGPGRSRSRRRSSRRGGSAQRMQARGPRSMPVRLFFPSQAERQSIVHSYECLIL